MCLCVGELEYPLSDFRTKRRGQVADDDDGWVSQGKTLHFAPVSDAEGFPEVNKNKLVASHRNNATQ